MSWARFKTETSVFLQKSNNIKQILGLRIPFWAKHPHQAFGRFLGHHKYQNNTDKVAFLSPCVAKADEFEDPNTDRHINYNVTYKKLTEYIEKNNINIPKYNELDFDDMGCGLGLTFSRPGGLRENVEYHVPGAFVRQMEGPGHAYHYLDTYLDRVKQQKKLPLLVDILNCAHGCNLGTATCKSEHIDDIDFKMNQLKQDCLQQIETQKQEISLDNYPLFDYFDKNLKLYHFVRTYTNKSHIIRLQDPSTQEKEILFNKLHKTTEDSRNINCFACGFKNCDNFAKALLNDLSHPESCIYYNKVELQNESAMAEQMLAKNQTLNMQNTETIHRILADIGGLTLQSDALEGSMQTISEKVVGLHKASQEIDSISATTHLLALNALVQSAHAGEAGRAFEVVSKEVKALALTTKEVVRETQTAESQIETEISTIGHISKEIRNKLTETQDHLQTIADEMGHN